MMWIIVGANCVTLVCVAYMSLEVLWFCRELGRLRAENARLEQDLAAPASEPGIQAGDPVYWDPSGTPVPARLYPGCATFTPAEPETPLHDVDVVLTPSLGASILGVALNDSQPVDRE